MKLLINKLCPVCNGLMVFLHRRGDSRGSWICPVCAYTRQREPVEPDMEEDGIHPGDFPRPRGRRAA